MLYESKNSQFSFENSVFLGTLEMVLFCKMLNIKGL